MGTLIRIHFGPGSGSIFSKCGSQDPNPLLRKGGSEDPDPLSPNVDPRIRIRIHVKMRWIRNAAFNPLSFHNINFRPNHLVLISLSRKLMKQKIKCLFLKKNLLGGGLCLLLVFKSFQGIEIWINCVTLNFIITLINYYTQQITISWADLGGGGTLIAGYRHVRRTLFHMDPDVILAIA